jgi:hypothetical protein
MPALNAPALMAETAANPCSSLSTCFVGDEEPESGRVEIRITACRP